MRYVSQSACWVVLALVLVSGSAIAGTIEGRVLTSKPGIDKTNVVIYVDDLEGPYPANAVATVDQRGLRFVPHVTVVVAGTTVEFLNSDPLAHNVFSISPAKRFNLGLYNRGTVRKMRFDKPGVVQLLCNVHQEMSAFIVVVKNPYFARANADGSFRISGVPAGKHRLLAWHEQLGEHAVEVEIPAAGVAVPTINLD